MTPCARCATPTSRAALTDVDGALVCPRCLARQAEAEIAHPRRNERS